MNKLIEVVTRCSSRSIGRSAWIGILAASVGIAASTPCLADARVAPLLDRITGGHFARPGVMAVIVGTLVYAVILGYAVRSSMPARSFAMPLNVLIALVGEWVALEIHNGFLGAGVPSSLGGIVVAATLGSIVTLFAAVAIKAIVRGQADALLPGRRPKVSAAYQRVLDPPPPGPSAERLAAVMSRAKR